MSNLYIEVYPGQSIALSALLEDKGHNLSAALKEWAKTLETAAKELDSIATKVANTPIKANIDTDNDIIELPDLPGAIYESIKDYLIIAPDVCSECGGALDEEYPTPEDIGFDDTGKLGD